MARPRRYDTLRTALRILDLRYTLRRDPTPKEIQDYCGLEIHHARGWCDAVSDLFAEHEEKETCA